MKYGCHNRPPFVPAYRATGSKQWIPTFGQPKCQYTLTELGKKDKKCAGCKHKKDANEQ